MKPDAAKLYETGNIAVANRNLKTGDAEKGFKEADVW